MSEEPENTPEAAPETAAETAAITDTPPDRLASNSRSPFYAPELLERGVGIRFDGVERTNVDEYCVSEGWVKVAAGKSKDRYGNALTIKLKGIVEPYFRS
jgi:hypothetical protein